jgi:hypothetical protein
MSWGAWLSHADGPVTVDWQPAPPRPSDVAVRDLLVSGPMTVRRLATLTGYTQHTVRAAIRRLGYRVGGPIGGVRRVRG